jgi:hypothetical protein
MPMKMLNDVPFCTAAYLSDEVGLGFRVEQAQNRTIVLL